MYIIEFHCCTNAISNATNSKESILKKYFNKPIKIFLIKCIFPKQDDVFASAKKAFARYMTDIIMQI